MSARVLGIVVSALTKKRRSPMANEITPIDAMRNTLTKMQPEFHAALPAQIPVEKFIRTTMTAVQMNPELLQADRRSLLGACMKAAQDGLMLDGREAAPVIFRTKEGPKVQYMPMIGGILKKIRNSGELASISAQVAYANDFFEYELGDDEKITHKPFLGGDRGKPLAVYAIARTKDGAVYREVMSVAEIEKVRQASRAANAGPWVQWWDEMARKTVIRRIAKRLPSSADVDHVFDADNEASGFAFDRRAPVNVTPAADEQIEPMSRLKKSIAAKDPEPVEVVDMTTGEIVESTEHVPASNA
jgi:recombination protein RecT